MQDLTQPAFSDCIVVGGGICGLVAARELANAGLSVLVLDKGRGVGGRTAARHIGEGPQDQGLCDYGAQHFTVREPRFQSLVNEWIAQGVVVPWAREFPCVEDSNYVKKELRYRGSPSMRGIAEHVAQSLNVRTSTRVVHMSWGKSGWRLRTEAGDSFDAEAVLLTPPLPQSMELVRSASVDVPANTLRKLTEFEYDPCIAVLALLDGPSSIPAPGGLRLAGEPLQWVADNNKKGISEERVSVTLHAGPEYSTTHLTAPRPETGRSLIDAARPWLGANVADFHVHCWRYSRPCSSFGDKFLRLPAPGPLLLAGDAFVGPRMEGAALSGFYSADAIISQAKQRS